MEHAQHSQEVQNSRIKLAQLWHFISSTKKQFRKTYLHNRIANEILKDDFDINYKITIHSPERSLKNVLTDCTALHFTYRGANDIDTFTALLDRGADCTIKNQNGQSVLHLIIKQFYKNYDVIDELPFINAVLSAHVKFQNSANPCDNDGISHLHGACITNHVEAVNLFLNSGASIDQTVNFDTPKFAGYTPLHFSVVFRSFDVAKILVNRAANINAQTAEGSSPLDLLMQPAKYNNILGPVVAEKENLIKLILEKGGISTIGVSSLQVACTLQDLTIAERLLHDGTNIDYAVPITSSWWAGNTALHFAVENNIKAVKMLLKRGAKIEVTNARGSTSLDLCSTYTDKYSMEDIHSILSCIDGWKEIHLTDGEIKLLDLIATLRDSDKFKLFLQSQIKDINAVVSIDSALLPGYNVLHLAATFFDKRENRHNKIIVEELLSRGIDINAQNTRGQTPIHLAFLKCPGEIILLLLKHLNEMEQVKDVVDEDNLSYLHIACSTNNTILVEKLLKNSDPNIVYKGKQIERFLKPGASPLHIVSIIGSRNMAGLLLKNGANLHALDAKGMTPIHWLLNPFWTNRHHIANIFFNSLIAQPLDCVVNGSGLSYLHIACLLGNAQAVEKLLDLGSNVNAVIKCDKNPDDYQSSNFTSNSAMYSNHTPLGMAIRKSNPNRAILELLLSKGADVLEKHVDKSRVIPLYRTSILVESTIVLRCFFQTLWDRNDVQESMKERWGLTKLHIACFLKNEEAVHKALDEGIDVNARTNADSEMFAGCTPLHLLVSLTDSTSFTLPIVQPSIDGIMNLLASRGADVTISNVKKDTPIHTFIKHQLGFHGGNLTKKLLLKAHLDFSINPMDSQGMSHFHLACLWHEVEIIEKFLQHGSVDVNQPIDYFASAYAGCTPLHLALNSPVETDAEWMKLSRIVDLLLQYGGNVAAKDAKGDTPLHKPAVFKSPELSLLEKLASHGGDVKSENIRCQTPIEICPDIYRLAENPLDNVQIFQKYGCKFNSFNRLTGEGYIPKIFILNQRMLSTSSEFKQFIRSSDVRLVDENSRTAIHNAVAFSTDMIYDTEIRNFNYAIESLLNIGIHIDHQDKSDQTALHYVARMENTIGVRTLLVFGADVNILDDNEKSAYFYALQHTENKNDLSGALAPNATKILRMHILKLQHLGIEINRLDQNLIKQRENCDDGLDNKFINGDSEVLSKEFFNQIDLTKNMKIGINSLTLFDFLSDTAMVNTYCFFSKSERDVVKNFLKTIQFNELHEIIGIINLQFKKMRKRLKLIDLALHSLRKILGFSVPGLCEEISKYLLNSDLKNLIQSAKLISKKRKISEMEKHTLVSETEK